MSARKPLEHRCTATSKRTGQRCGNAAMIDRTVCRHHGGKTPRGVSSPHWQHGRYSKALTGRLLAVLESARNDPALLSLRDEIALVTAAVEDLLVKLEASDESGSTYLWDAVARQLSIRQRLVSAEVRHMALAGQFLTTEEASALFASVVEIVKAHTTEEEQMLIAAEFERLMSRSNGPFTVE